jgi:hypothetical protein
MSNNSNHIKSLTYVSTDLQKLREDIHRAVDLRIDQFLRISKVVEILSTTNKITWLKTEEALFIFYELLIKYKYIDCNFSIFEAHFIDSESIPDKIIFLKPTNQLPYIMKELEEYNYIAKCEQRHIRLSQHFLDHSGKPISNNILRSSLEKGLGKIAKQFIDEKIIGELLKYKSKG